MFSLRSVAGLSFSFLTAVAFAAESGLTVKADADFLALHVSGQIPEGATRLEYRLAEKGSIPEGAKWTPLAMKERSYAADLPLSHSHWSELEVRALKGETVLSRRSTSARAPKLDLLTPERIAALPENERAAWTSYVNRSKAAFQVEFDTLAAECRKLALPRSKPAPSNREEFEFDSARQVAWFVSPEASQLAEGVMSYQTPSGGWSKSIDFRAGPRSPGTHWTSQSGEDGWHYCGTIDNRATTEQIELLAGVFTATKREAVKVAAWRGLEYLLDAQFPNGGWPQNYPLESGYHEAITLNDNAMIHVLELLLSVAQGEAPFAWTDEALRARAQGAVHRGIACLAAMQVMVDGKRTVWCAQHDPLTLEPVRARKKEPPSLSGSESGEVIRFLMRKAPIRADITAMIEPALVWYEAHRLTGLRKTKNAAGKTDYVADPDSKEVYWARFYDVQTGAPMFAGADDGVVYASFSEMAAKNKVAYDFFTTKPGELLEKERARWQKRVAKGK